MFALFTTSLCAWFSGGTDGDRIFILLGHLAFRIS